jgi:hypothetical protein
MFKLVVGQKTVASKNKTTFSLNPPSTIASDAASAASILPNVTNSVPMNPCHLHKGSMSWNTPESETGGPELRRPKMNPTCSGVITTDRPFNSKTKLGTVMLSSIKRQSA